MPMLPAPFSNVSAESRHLALEIVQAHAPGDFWRTFMVNPLLLYPSSHAVLVPISLTSNTRFNRAITRDDNISPLGAYFAMNSGANYRGDHARNWAVGVVREGIDTLPREYDSQEPLIALETVDGLVVDILMGGHRINAMGEAGTILRNEGHLVAARKFDCCPMYLFHGELGDAVTDQFMTTLALEDNWGNDLARINDASSTVLLVMTSVVERAGRLKLNPLTADYDSAMSYPTLWGTINTSLECSPNDALGKHSPKRDLRCAMVDMIRNLDVWLPLGSLLTKVVPCTAKPGSIHQASVLQQTAALDWVRIMSDVLDIRYQPVVQWAAFDAVNTHINAGNPFITNAEVYSKIGPGNDNTELAMFASTAGLRNESHGILASGQTILNGFNQTRAKDNRKFAYFISLADMGRFRRWDHGFVSAVGCFALAHWIIFGTTSYNSVLATRRSYKSLGVHRHTLPTDNYCSYLAAHTPKGFFRRLYKMAEESTHIFDVGHFHTKFWIELLVPAFEVPDVFTPPTVVVPKSQPSLVWGRDKIPEALAIFPGFGAGLVHALHTYTTTGNREGVDGFGGMFRLLDHKTTLVGMQELKDAKMVPAGLPVTAGTRWSKINDYVPRAVTPPPVDPPAPRKSVSPPNVPILAPPKSPMPPVLPPPPRKVSVPAPDSPVATLNSNLRPARPPPATPNEKELFSDQTSAVASAALEHDLFAEFDDQDTLYDELDIAPTAAVAPENNLFDEFDDEDDLYDELEIAPAGDLPDVALSEGQENGGDGICVEQDGDVVTPDNGDKDVIWGPITPEKKSSPLGSPTQTVDSVPSPILTESQTPAASNDVMEVFLKQLVAHLTEDDIPDSHDDDDNGPEMRSDPPAPTTPRNKADSINVLGSPLFTDEEVESEEADMDAYITKLMGAIRGTPDYIRIVEDMKTVAFKRTGSLISVPTRKRRIQKRTHSTSTSAAVSPAVGRVNKKKRESEE